MEELKSHDTSEDTYGSKQIIKGENNKIVEKTKLKLDGMINTHSMFACNGAGSEVKMYSRGEKFIAVYDKDGKNISQVHSGSDGKIMSYRIYGGKP
jgi:hypothetical protein